MTQYRSEYIPIDILEERTYLGVGRAGKPCAPCLSEDNEYLVAEIQRGMEEARAMAGI
jgi:hypothetical protein